MGIEKSKPIENHSIENFIKKTNESSLTDPHNEDSSDGSKGQTKVNYNGSGHKNDVTGTTEALKNGSDQIKTTQELPKTNNPENEETKAPLKSAHIKKKVIKKTICLCDGGDEYDNERELFKDTRSENLNQEKVVSKKSTSKQPEFTRFEMDYSKYEMDDESSHESQCSQ